MPLGTALEALIAFVSSRQESNLHRFLRREASYPLNDERVGIENSILYTPI